MKFIPLHTKNTAIIYKNSLCSTASVIVLLFIILSVMVPVLLVSLLSPYSGIAESRVLYEQPRLQFKFQHLLLAETETDETNSNLTEKWIICSTFPKLREGMQNYTKKCEGSKYWTEDLNRDTINDRAHFEIQLNTRSRPITNFDLVLLFDAKLAHKCILYPPAVLTHSLAVPAASKLFNGLILIKAELQLKQYMEFACPFPGRTSKTHFHHLEINANASADLEQYRIERLLQEVKENPAFFQLAIEETYFHRQPTPGIRIQLDINILQVPARYHLNIWERLGQFWLYFASFFGISFYIMNRVKDLLFSRGFIRSWEIIPWKKLY